MPTTERELPTLLVVIAVIGYYNLITILFKNDSNAENPTKVI